MLVTVCCLLFLTRFFLYVIDRNGKLTQKIFNIKLPQSKYLHDSRTAVILQYQSVKEEYIKLTTIFVFDFLLLQFLVCFR